MDKNKISLIKSVLNLVIILLLGVTGVIFSMLYIETFTQGFVFHYKILLKVVSIVAIISISVLTLVFYKTNAKIVYKCLYIAIILIAFFMVLLYVLNASGVMAKIKSVEQLRKYIQSMGAYAWLTFVILQFLQVWLLPIPAFVSVGVGVLLFGPLKAAIYSFIGILLGSVLAFFIGKFLGYKVASWLVGKETLDKALLSVKGKDKAVLTFMFLFPFFPDDVLCFVAGLSTMSVKFFLIMITIVRFITVFISCYAYNNSLIPFNTWWGLLIWGVFIALTLYLTFFVYKKGDKIESFFKKLFSKKENSNKN